MSVPERPSWCVCHDGFWDRGLHDPQCRHDEIEDREIRITELTMLRPMGTAPKESEPSGQYGPNLLLWIEDQFEIMCWDSKYEIWVVDCACEKWTCCHNSYLETDPDGWLPLPDRSPKPTDEEIQEVIEWMIRMATHYGNLLDLLPSDQELGDPLG